MTKQNIEKFLKSFGYEGKNKNVICSSFGKTEMKAKTLDQALIDNKNGGDIYFVVNPGGTRDCHLTQLRALFTDLDAGRDPKGKYLSPSKVERAKAAMRKRINAFPIAPSYIVETRNGLHVYWLIEPKLNCSATLNLYNTIQRRINAFFSSVGSDTKVMKACQLMRVPYTKWYKKWEGKKETFLTKLNVKKPNLVYDINAVAALTKNMSSTARLRTAADYQSYTKPTYPKDPRKADKPKANKNELKALQKALSEEDDESDDERGTSLLIEVVSFLKDASFFFNGKGSKFLGKQAYLLSQRVSNQFHVS